MKKMNAIMMVVISVLVASCGGETVSGSIENDGGNPVLEGNDDEFVPLTKAVVSDTNQNVAANAGYISDGSTIEVPTGFTIDRCVMTAAPAIIDGSAISVRVSVNTTTGVVTCKKVVQTRENIPAEEQGCIAAYTIICIRSTFI